jgi:ABC-2 type transport system permease protein
MRRYLRLIFNDHLKLVLIFLVGAGAFYYQQWLQTLPEDFPSAFVLAILLSIALTRSPIRTFLKEADLVFLLPLETKLSGYFWYSKAYSFFIQCYIVTLLFAALLPLYLYVEKSSILSILIMLFVLYMVKAWNVFMTWNIQYFIENSIRFSDAIIRFTVNFVFCYFLFSQAPLFYLVVIGLIMLSLLFYFDRFTSAKKRLKWEQLIELESKRMMMFYRIANLFTDVPTVKEQVRKRSWLNWLTTRIPFSSEGTYKYLFIRTFIRSSDYFGIYLRLLIIGGTLLYFLPFGYAKLIIYLFFCYLSGFQLLPLYRHHATKIWVDLYPLSKEDKHESFLYILRRLLYINGVLLAVVPLAAGQWIISGFALFLGFIFNYFFVCYFTKRQLHKYDEVS